MSDVHDNDGGHHHGHPASQIELRAPRLRPCSWRRVSFQLMP